MHKYKYIYIWYMYKDPFGNDVSGLRDVVPMVKPRDPDPRRALPSLSKSRNPNPQAERMGVDGRQVF